MTEAEQFQAAIAELGALADSDDIANFLIVQGVRGMRRAPNYCPVANYTKKKCPWGKFVCAGLERIRCSSASTCAYSGENNADIPASVRAFMARFDCGAFPELEQTNG